jgi:outer membrane protein
MKSFVLKFLCLAVLTCGTATVQAQVKIGVFDIRKVFDGYYKTQQADANLKEEAGDLEKQRSEMITDYKKGEDEYRKSLDRANDQAVSSEERDKAKQAAEKKLLELKEKEQLVTQFERSARAKLDEKKRRKRDQIVTEIRDIVNAKAKAGGFTLVLDTAAESINNTPVILYNNGENDLTDAVLNHLNSTAPPGLLKQLDEKKAADQKKADEQKKNDEKKK